MERNRGIDTVGGIMIIFMILRHCIIRSVKVTLFGGVIAYYPLLFFMAWFFFKGGMYYREEPFLQTFSKSFSRLLIPYFVFTAISVLFAVIVRGLISGTSGVQFTLTSIIPYIKREGAVECNAPLWFLLSFFFVRIFFAYSRHFRIPTILVSAVSLLAGFGLYLINLPVGLYFGNIATGLLFYSLGYCLKDTQFKKPVYIIAGCVYCIFLAYCIVTRDVTGTFNNNIHTPYIPTILFYLAGCIFFNNIFTKYPRIQTSWLAAIGKDSMSYYVVHFIIISSFLYFNDQLLEWPDIYVMLSLIVLEAILLPPACKLLRNESVQWMTGQGRNTVQLSLGNQTAILIFTSAVIVSMMAYLFVIATHVH